MDRKTPASSSLSSTALAKFVNSAGSATRNVDVGNKPSLPNQAGNVVNFVRSDVYNVFPQPPSTAAQAPVYPTYSGYSTVPPPLQTKAGTAFASAAGGAAPLIGAAPATLGPQLVSYPTPLSFPTMATTNNIVTQPQRNLAPGTPLLEGGSQINALAAYGALIPNVQPGGVRIFDPFAYFAGFLAGMRHGIAISVPTSPTQLLPTPSTSISPTSSTGSDWSSSYSRRGPVGANVFVNHLPLDFTNDDLTKEFAPYGKILSANVYKDYTTGVSKGMGFVSYDNTISAAAAVRAMNNKVVGGFRLAVRLKREDVTPSSSSKPY